jgi:hypothetical protein
MILSALQMNTNHTEGEENPCIRVLWRSRINRIYIIIKGDALARLVIRGQIVQQWLSASWSAGRPNICSVLELGSLRTRGTNGAAPV